MQKLLIVKGRAGLGNRVLCALTGLLYARITGRQLVIDWRDDVYSDDRINAFSRYFRCPESAAVESIANEASVFPQLWTARLHESSKAVQKSIDPASMRDPEGWRPYSIDVAKIDYPQEALVMWSYNEQIDALRGRFTGERANLRKQGADAILRDLLRSAFVVHPEVLQRASSVRSRWPAGRVLGVHVRYLDKRSRLRAIRRAVERIMRQDPPPRLFLATDNAGIEQSFREIYPDLLTSRKWFPTRGRSMHQNPDCLDRLENGMEAMTDLCLLSGCDDLVLDASSAFVRLATLLTEAPAKRIVNVAAGHWLPPRVRYRLWLTWIRLKGFKRPSGVVPGTGARVQ